jgi:hypothetical protein
MSVIATPTAIALPYTTGSMGSPALAKSVEGHQVNLTLVDGTRLDGVTLVSAGRGSVQTLWVEVDGVDLIVGKHEVAELATVAA